MTAQTFLSRDPTIPQDQKQNLPAAKQKNVRASEMIYMIVFAKISPVKELKVSASQVLKDWCGYWPVTYACGLCLSFMLPCQHKLLN